MNEQRKDENVPAPGAGRKWALAAASTLFSLLLAEGVCRVAVPAPARVNITVNPPTNAVPAEVRLPVHPEQGGLYVETPAGRRLRPNTTALIERHALSGVPVEIRTNALGYRNREIGEKRGKRILFLGDSITFADYLPEEQCFVRRVETLARAQGKDWETVNAGVGAVSLKTELAILLETGLALKPDAVVLGWYLNDFQDSPGVEVSGLSPLAQRSRLAYALGMLTGRGRGAGAGGLPLEHWQADWKRNDMPFLVDRNPAKEAFYREVERFFFDWGGAWSPRAWEVMNPLLDELRRLSKEHAFRLAVFALPSRQQVEAPFDTALPQRNLGEWAKRNDTLFLDILPVLQAELQAGKGPLFYDQCHHTPQASEAVGLAIFNWLAKKL